MKKKYQITLVVIGCLVVLIGLSYAYYMVNSNTVGNTGSTTVKTVTIEDVGFNIEGLLEFNDLDIYPGHKNISKIKVTALGNNDTINYKLVWEGINTLNTPIKYYVYKTSTNEEASITCQKEVEQIGATKKYYETCTNNNIDNLGTIINEGEITNTNDKKEFILSENEVIKGTKEGNIIYYYVVLEYPNLEESQNIDMGGKFEGRVTVKKEEDMLADITIKKMYKKIENGYEEITTMPEEGYIINEEKSTCTNNAKLIMQNREIVATNLQTNGTECNIYFDIEQGRVINSEIIASSNGTKTNFTSNSSNDGTLGVYNAPDDDGTSYYYRGAVDNNWIKFGNFYWRIIRINGDGSIRIIYSGTSVEGIYGTVSIGNDTTIGKTAFTEGDIKNNNKIVYQDNAGVGYMYGTANSNNYNATHTNANNSTIKQLVDKWYENNILGKEFEKYIDRNAGFCGDRTVNNGNTSWWDDDTKLGYAANKTAYGSMSRLYPNWKKAEIQIPSFKCTNNNDLYTVNSRHGTASTKGNKALTYPIALITADEVAFAGLYVAEANSSFYLYNGLDYWTMTPIGYDGNMARIFGISKRGDYSINWPHASNNAVRPVINLKADTKFTGNGTIQKPYMVEGA